MKKIIKETEAATVVKANSKAKSNAKKQAKLHTEKSNNAVEQALQATSDLGSKLIAKMRRGVVHFTFINRLGKEITTAGTLLKNKIPTTRKVAGAVKPRDKEYVVFYDTKHGVRRQFNRHQVVAIA